METIILVLSPLIFLLIAWIAKKIFTKFNLDLDTQLLALGYIKKAVERVESIALETGYKGPEKLKLALTLLDRFMLENPKIVPYIRGKEQSLIESVLKSDLTGDSLTPSKR